jgi:hypothetical protein
MDRKYTNFVLFRGHPKCTKNDIFGLKIYRLATLITDDRVALQQKLVITSSTLGASSKVARFFLKQNTKTGTIYFTKCP